MPHFSLRSSKEKVSTGGDIVIRGLIFDFDGLILDTESTVYQSWLELFQEFGQVLPFDEWGQIIGISVNEHFDPLERLEKALGYPLKDRENVRAHRLERELALIDQQPILPGVVDYLEDARRLGLKLAIASSSELDWVGGHLQRLGLIGYFEAVHTSDDVQRAKPHPELYNLALKSLALKSDEAIVLEDSPNGVTAAQAAGIFSVAVPNPLTAQLDLDHADLRLTSLAEIPLEMLIKKVETKLNS